MKRPWSQYILLIIVGGVFTSLYLPLLPTAVAISETKHSQYRAGEILVKLKASDDIFKLKFTGDTPVVQIADDYSRNPSVEYAEPNYIYSLSAFEPNDVYYPQQWHLRQIGAPLAWETTTGSPDVVVAVIDSGVDINHADLKQNIWTNPNEIANDGIDNDSNGYIDDAHGWDFIENSNDPRPDAAPPYSRTALHHGTVVAGIIAAAGNNIEGVAGVSWKTRIMPLRVLDKQGQGEVENVARAVDYAVKNGADILNLSFVGSGASQLLESALGRAYAAGVLVVVAAGNADIASGVNLDVSPRYPICYDRQSSVNWIIGVTAADVLDQHAPFANYGAACVDIAAPGYSIFSTQVFDLQKSLSEAYGGGWSGTSLAAPAVSGAAALLKSQHRDYSPLQLTEILLSSADNIIASNRDYGRGMGRGRLNLARALSGAQNTEKSPPRENVFEGSRIVVAPASALAPEVRLYSMRGEQKQIWPMFDKSKRNGAAVAVAENARFLPEDDRTVGLSGLIRGEQLVVVGEGQGGLGRLRVIDITGQVISQWNAFDIPFRGGVNVAAGDILGDGRSSVLVAPLSGGGPQVRIFETGGRLINQFFAYDKKLRGGFSVAAADVDGDKKTEIVVSSLTHDLPVRVFNNKGELLREWFAYPTFRGGVSVAAGDLDGRGIASIITAPQQGGGPQVRIFDGGGSLLGQFMVFNESFRGGVSLAVGDIDGDGRGEIAAAPVSRGGPQIRIFTPRARFLGQFFVYDQQFRGGLRLAIMR